MVGSPETSPSLPVVRSQRYSVEHFNVSKEGYAGLRLQGFAVESFRSCQVAHCRRGRFSVDHGSRRYSALYTLPVPPQRFTRRGPITSTDLLSSESDAAPPGLTWLDTATAFTSFDSYLYERGPGRGGAGRP